MKGIILSLCLIVFTINSVNACACEEIKTKEAFHNSDVIFTGKLIAKEHKKTEIDAPKINSKQSYTRSVYVFEIINIIKGKKIKDHITITTKFKELSFEKGKKYLIYAYFSEYLLTTNFYLNGEKVNPFLVTDKCTKSKNLQFTSKKELKKLRRLAKK